LDHAGVTTSQAVVTSFGPGTAGKAVQHSAFPASLKVWIPVLPAFLVASSASRLSCPAMALAYLGASFNAASSRVRTSVGRPSRNCLLAIAYLSLSARRP